MGCRRGPRIARTECERDGLIHLGPSVIDRPLPPSARKKVLSGLRTRSRVWVFVNFVRRKRGRLSVHADDTVTVHCIDSVRLTRRDIFTITRTY